MSVQIFNDIDVATIGLAAPQPVLHIDEATGRRTCALGITPDKFVTPRVRFVESLATLPTTTLAVVADDPAFFSWVKELEEHVQAAVQIAGIRLPPGPFKSQFDGNSLRCMIVSAPSVFDLDRVHVSDPAQWPVAGDEVRLVLAPTIRLGKSGWGIVFVVSQVLGPLPPPAAPAPASPARTEEIEVTVADASEPVSEPIDCLFPESVDVWGDDDF